MVTRVQKWGNSQGLRLSKQVLSELDISVGDEVRVTFDPQSGHEQRERRPALVVSNDLFNKHTGLCMGAAPDEVLDEALALLDACIY